MKKGVQLPQHPRRAFLKQTSAMALAATASSVLSEPSLLAAPAPEKNAESLVTVLYESLTDKQRKQVCFDWNKT